MPYVQGLCFGDTAGGGVEVGIKITKTKKGRSCEFPSGGYRWRHKVVFTVLPIVPAGVHDRSVSTAAAQLQSSDFFIASPCVTYHCVAVRGGGLFLLAVEIDCVFVKRSW